MEESDISKIMTPEELVSCGIERLTLEERTALRSWGLRIFSLGAAVIDEIFEVRHSGHLIELLDGSTWEVDDLDVEMARAAFGVGDKVVIADGEMIAIEPERKVAVSSCD